MIFDPNIYRGRAYPSPPCWALVIDVYQTELGQAVDEFRTVTSSIRDIAAAFRLELHKGQHGFQQAEVPTDLCVVLLATNRKIGVHHCGIWWQGSLLHALDGEVIYQDMASIRDAYRVVEFWVKPELTA